MSEATKRPRKIGLKQKMALLEVIKRKEHEDRINYAKVAEITGLGAVNLRRLWCDYTKGMIDLGPPETVLEEKLDQRAMFEKKMDLLQRYELFLIGDADAKLSKVEQLAKVKVSGGTEARKVANVMKELRQTSAQLETTQKGYVFVVEEIRRAQTAPDKMIPGPLPVEVKRELVSANDEQVAMRALGLIPD